MTNQNNSEKKQVTQDTKSFNPLGRKMSARGYESIMAGADTENPLVEFDQYSVPKFNLANFENAKKSTLAYNKDTGYIAREELDNIAKNVEEYQEDVKNLFYAVQPEFNKPYNLSPLPVQLIDTTGTMLEAAGHSAGRMVNQSKNAVLSLPHTIAEKEWNFFISSFDDKDPDKENAFFGIKSYFDAGFTDIQYADVDKMIGADGKLLSDRSKDIIRKYQQLEEFRKDNTNRMKVEQLYEDERDSVVADVFKPTKIVNALGGNIPENKGDKGTVTGFLTELAGDTAGSLAVSYVTGQLARGAFTAVGTAAAKLAPKIAPMVLGQAAVVGNTAVFTPSFLSQFENIRTQALLRGESLDKANAAGFVAGLAEGGLEFIGFKAFNRLMSKKGFLRNVLLRDILPESLQEGAQTLSENIITETFGITDKQFTDIMTEVGVAMLGGALGGAAFVKGIRGGAERAAGWSVASYSDFVNKLKTFKQSDIKKGTELARQEIQKDYLKEFKETVKQEKVEEPTKEVRQVADTVKEYVGDMYRVYAEKAKTYSPNITKEQLDNGWKAVMNLVQAQYQDGSVTKAFDGVIDNVLTFIDKTNNTIKDNVNKTKEMFVKKGYSKELADKLSSKEWAVQHQAQWELAENEITQTLVRSGVEESEAKISAKFLKGLLYETTFMNPQIKVADILTALDVQLANTQIAYIRGQDAEIPEMFSSAASQVRRKRKDSTISDRYQTALRIATLFENNKENESEIKKELFGNSDTDVSLSKIVSDFVFLTQAEDRVLNNMPIALKEDLSSKDYFTMAVMRAQGATQADINEAFGLKMNVKEDPDTVREQVLDKLYPKLTDRQIKSINFMAEEIESKEAKNPPKTVSGFYDVGYGVPSIVDTAAGTALHEFGHFTITKVLFEGLRLDNMGLLPRDNGINRIATYFRDKMKRDGVVLNERQWQETLVDSLVTYVRTGNTGDPELNSLFAEFNNIYNQNLKKVSGSLLADRSDRKNLTKEQKTDIVSGVGNVVENLNAANVSEQADTLIENASKFASASGEVASAKAIYDDAKAFLNRFPIENNAQYEAALETALAANDPVLMAGVAFDIATQGKELAVSTLLDNAANIDTENYVETDVSGRVVIPREGKTSEEDAFFWTDDETGTRTVRAARQYAGVTEQIKDISIKDVFKSVTTGLKGLVQSIDSAAAEASPRLQSIVNRAFYDYSEKVLNVKDKIEVITNKIRENEKKFKDNPDNLFTREQFVKNFWLPLANGDKTGYEKAGKTLEKHLGKEAGEAWTDLVKEIKSVKELLVKKGLPKELFKVETYFPLQVRDYNGLMTKYFKNSSVYSANKKLINRAIREEKKKLGDKKMTPKQEMALRVKLINEINSRYQRNDDTNKVSSFFKREVMEHSAEMMEYYKDPFETLSDFFESAYRTAMMRDLVGFVQYDKNGNAILSEGQGRIGNLLVELNSQELTTTEAEALNNFDAKMRFLAKRDDTRPGFFKYVRKINNLTMLGSITNTINQVGDLYLVATAFGSDAVINAINDIVKGQQITVRDINAQSANELFRPQGDDVLDTSTKKVFKLTGFEKADIAMKEVTINAAAKWFRKALSGKPDSTDYKVAMKYINQCYPVGSFDANTRAEIINNLKNGNFDNSDSKFVLWFMLCKFQPINAATVPAQYNSMGDFGKLCYQFSTVAIRQLEFLTSFYKDRLQAGGGKEVAKQFARMLMFLIGIGIPKEILVSVLKGQKPDLATTVAMSPLHPIGINEYMLSLAKREGLGSAASELVSPSFGVLDNVSKDLYRAVTFKDYKGHTLKNVPVFGSIVYWYMFGGKDYNEKVKQELFDLTPSLNDSENAINILGGFDNVA